MVCPFCLHKKTEVYNSRPTKKLNAMWRRRRCPACKREFTTREMVDASSVLRVQTPGKKTQLYSRATLLLSVLQACDHLPRPDDAYWLCDTIEQALLHQAATSNNLITTNDITKVALATLKRFNTPAFIKYLSYHSGDLDNRSIKRQLRG